jgi:hypothetical protein
LLALWFPLSDAPPGASAEHCSRRPRAGIDGRQASLLERLTLGGHGPPENSHRNAAAGAIASCAAPCVVLPGGDLRDLPIALSTCRFRPIGVR